MGNPMPDAGRSMTHGNGVIAPADAGRADREARDRSLAIAVPIANAILLGALLFFAMQLAFALQLHRPTGFKALFACVTGFAVVARRLQRPLARVNAALLLTPLIAGILIYETYSAWSRPRDGTAAWLTGRTFDSRSLWESVEDERRNDPSVVSYVIPRALLTHHLVLESWEPEEVARTVQPNWGIVVDGVQMLPLSGVANRPTVFGNESGTRIVYESDEHGFNNPRGIWDAGRVQVAIIGDSFSHGADIAPEATTAAHIRKRYPRALTLGMSANGPLMEYASLKEYLVDEKPGIVLWAYYLNDLSDLEVEKDSRLLWRYLEDDGFRQGLAAKQARVDTVLEAYLEDIRRRTPRRWPAILERAGLTRRNTPLWLQDLVTTDQHSSLAAFLRLDGFTWLVTKRFLEENYYEQPPDYALFERILTKARDVVASWDGQLYFVYLPALHNLAPRHRHITTREPLLALVKRLGIPVIDVHQVFLDHPDAERLRFHYESHANEAGYELHAKTILEALEASAAPSPASGGPTRHPPP